MPKWARILIALFVVLLVSFAYLWFFGFQTLILLEARYLTRKAPAVSMAPAQLADLSISRSPGRKLSYFGYEFEVPWNDMINVHTTSGVNLPVSPTATLTFPAADQTGTPRAYDPLPKIRARVYMKIGDCAELGSRSTRQPAAP